MITSELRVLRSAAGHYVGREYFDSEFCYWGPHSRESRYYSKEDATAELASLIVLSADCVEDYCAVCEYLSCLARGLDHETAVSDTLDVYDSELRIQAGARVPGPVYEPSVHVDGPEICDAPAPRVPGPVYDDAIPF